MAVSLQAMFVLCSTLANHARSTGLTKRTRRIAAAFGDLARLLLVPAIAYLIAALLWGWWLPLI
jgi:hypothetical protein